MNRTNDTAPFDPSNNHLYCYPLVLCTLRYSVGVMHSNAGTLGEIVGRTCTHRAFYEKEWNLGGCWVGENSHKILVFVQGHFDSISMGSIRGKYKNGRSEISGAVVLTTYICRANMAISAD